MEAVLKPCRGKAGFDHLGSAPRFAVAFSGAVGVVQSAVARRRFHGAPRAGATPSAPVFSAASKVVRASANSITCNDDAVDLDEVVGSNDADAMVSRRG
ncbi:hypothetical protein [Gordonia oryzae]|uniref:hypothetical protein n=1 Tax=Gordonia oryzae TaxID=2487349 RepID=UPI00161A3D34|nr:hypothetical protein [Gordonia oryzae]